MRRSDFLAHRYQRADGGKEIVFAEVKLKIGTYALDRKHHAIEKPDIRKEG
jgi:hypothetical protein